MSLKQEHTLGWIGLQLAEKQRQVEQGQQLQIDQERREQNSKSQDMGMQMTQHAIDAEDRQYERKLQLANLLQKTVQAGEDKTKLEGMKENYGRPLQEAKTEKEKATAGLQTRRTSDIEQDNSRADSELERKRQADRAGYYAKLRGQNVGALGQIGSRFATPNVFGHTQLQMDPGFAQSLSGLLSGGRNYESFDQSTPPEDIPALPGNEAQSRGGGTDLNIDTGQMAPRVTPRTLFRPAAPRDPNVQPLRPAELSKHAEAANQSRIAKNELTTLYDYADKELQDEDFGALGGLGVGNAVKDITGSVLKAIPGEPGEGLRQGTERRAVFSGNIGKQLAQLIHDFSGAQSSDQEAQRLGGGLGLGAAKWQTIINQGVNAFANDKKTFMKVLKAAIEWKGRTQANESQIVKDQGIRVGDSAPALASDGGDVAKIRQYQQEHPEASDEEAMDALDL